MSRASPPLLFLCGVAALWTGVRGASLWWDARSDVSFAQMGGDAPPAATPTGRAGQVAVAHAYAGQRRRAGDADRRWAVAFAATGKRPTLPPQSPRLGIDPSTIAPMIGGGGSLVDPVVRSVPPMASQSVAPQAALPLLSAPAAAPMRDRVLADACEGRPDRWTLSGWAFVRPDGAPATIGQGLLGGSQVGVRAGRRFGRAEGYVRVVSSGRLGDGAEGAAGIALQPVRGIPVTLAAERRQQLGGSGGRSVWAAMATGGVSGLALPLRFRLDGYAAAGVVGARRRDLFAEGSIVARRPLLRVAGVEVEAGAGMWAAVQPDVARVDVGPSVSARLPLGGVTPRLSLDWRQRVEGDARPRSGPAVTLAADF